MSESQGTVYYLFPDKYTRQEIGVVDTVEDEEGTEFLRLKFENWEGIQHDENDPDSIYILLSSKKERTNDQDD